MPSRRSLCVCPCSAPKEDRRERLQNYRPRLRESRAGGGKTVLSISVERGRLRDEAANGNDAAAACVSSLALSLTPAAPSFFPSFLSRYEEKWPTD